MVLSLEPDATLAPNPTSEASHPRRPPRLRNPAEQESPARGSVVSRRHALPPGRDLNLGHDLHGYPLLLVPVILTSTWLLACLTLMLSRAGNSAVVEQRVQTLVPDSATQERQRMVPSEQPVSMRRTAPSIVSAAGEARNATASAICSAV
jgi:hypothetical protein